MRTLRNANKDTEGVVQEFIGSAYDNVKLVADNLDNIQAIVDAINDLDAGSFATFAQGATADTALQPADIDSIAELNAILTSETLIDTADSRLSDARVPTAHVHTEGEISDLQAYLLQVDLDDLAKLNAIVTDATLIDTADARLSDARAPTAHGHTYAELTAVPTTVAGYGITDAYTKIETDALTYDYPDLTSLPTTLAGYGITDAAPSSHVGGDIHIDWSITGAEDVHPDRYLNVDTVYTHPATHPFSILTGLPTTLGGYGIADNISVLANDSGYLLPADINTLVELNAIVADATLGDSADFATAAQGVLADTALQPSAVDHDTLLNYVADEHLPSSTFATAAQGATADTALQSIDPDSISMDMVADIPTDTYLGRITAATGTVEVLTNAQLKTALDLTGTNSGDQTDITDIASTKAQFDVALSDGAFAYAGAAYHDGFSDYVADEHLPSSTFATAAQGALADTSLQTAGNYATAAQGILADAALPAANAGTAAAEDVGYFATSAQGALADTALQAGSYATFAQGALADTAIQPAVLTSTIAGRMLIKGTYNASTNTPDLDTTPIATLQGDTYRVSVAGSFFGSVNLEVDDLVVALQDTATSVTHWVVVNKNLDSADFATASQGTLADSALQTADINTLAELNAILSTPDLIDTDDARLLPFDGDALESLGIAAGWLPTAVGDNTTAWAAPAAVDGSDLTSVAILTDKVITSDGAGGVTWEDPVVYADVITTKGDLEGFSTVRARLGVGADDEVLTADSAFPLGIKWVAPSAQSVAGMTSQFKSTNFVLSNKHDIYSDSGLDHTLPSSPLAGWVCVVRDFDSDASNNNITVQRNGATIDGAAVDYVMATDAQIVSFMCDVDGNWITSSSAEVVPSYTALVKIVTGVTYTILEADNGYRLLFDDPAAIAVTLPDGLTAGHNFIATQIGVGIPTITPGTDTINGDSGMGEVTPDAQWGSLIFVQYTAGSWLAEYTKAGSYLSLP
jgi:hypothetical protein